MVRKNESMQCPTGTGYSGNLYPIFSRENISRSARRDVFSIASAKSAKIARTSRSLFSCRPAFRASILLAAAGMLPAAAAGWTGVLCGGRFFAVRQYAGHGGQNARAPQERNQPVCDLCQFIPLHCAFTFFAAQMSLRQQSAQVFVA